MAKFGHGTTIQKVVYPKSDAFTLLAAIRFKKELNILKKEMRNTLADEGFTCIPAIAVGVPYNLFMDQFGNLYINIEVVSVLRPLENATVAVSGLFDTSGRQQLERLFDAMDVRFTESNSFTLSNGTTFEGLDAYCLQLYLKNFAFEGLHSGTPLARLKQQPVQHVQDFKLEL